MNVYKKSAFLRLILLSLCALVDTMGPCLFARTFPNQTKTELIKNSTLQGDEVSDCGLYCSAPVRHRTCCERFGLNVNNDSDIIISASSSWYTKHGPDRAALFEIDNYHKPSGGIAGWAAATNDANQWIQVDFQSVRRVTGILLQGRGMGNHNQWVTSFRVLFSDDGEVFYSTAVIEGTFDRHTVARRFFDRPIVARYIRVNPVTWYGHVTLRFDLLGCAA